MDKAGKSAALESLKGVFEESGAVVVTHYTGLSVAEMTKLRGMLRKDGAQLKVVKNTLAQIVQEIHTIKITVDELKSSQDLGRSQKQVIKC